MSNKEPELEKLISYSATLGRLTTMDEKQLLEMFHDLDNIEAVQRIADCAYHFVENFEAEVDEEVNGISDEEDAKSLDDCQRYRDYKSDQRN